MSKHNEMAISPRPNNDPLRAEGQKGWVNLRPASGDRGIEVTPPEGPFQCAHPPEKRSKWSTLHPASQPAGKRQSLALWVENTRLSSGLFTSRPQRLRRSAEIRRG